MTTLKQQFSQYRQWILHWVVTVLEMQDVANSCFWARKKIKIPENGIVLTQLLIDSVGTYHKQQDSPGGTTGDFDIYLTEIRDVSEFILRIDAYGEDALTNLIMLKNSLEIWHEALANHGLGFQQVIKSPRELTQFEDTEYVQQAQMDIAFNIVSYVEYDLGAIEKLTDMNYQIVSDGDDIATDEFEVDITE